LPYHNLAGSKYIALGMENTLPKHFQGMRKSKNHKRILNKNNPHVSHKRLAWGGFVSLTYREGWKEVFL